jgi:hypothetical protein
MKPISLFLLLLALAGSGCSPRGWTARWFIVQAENALGKAHQLKDKKTGFDERLPFYAKACGYYVKAYKVDPSVFTLIRIEEAADCCWKASLPEEEALFRAFEAMYSAAHPQESEYGDSGVGMMDMGG